jgi:glycosyltransferase involved in cell wall biosynthesis
MDRISVIIPAYNACQTIADFVESVLLGIVKPLEVIIFDDCSTGAIVETLAPRHP